MALSKLNNDSFADTAVHGRRNLIINGAMQVAQRGTSSTGLTDTKQGYQTVDRIATAIGDTNLVGELTMSQESITDLAGFSKAMKFACTTADTSTNAAEFGVIRYNFEGQDLQGIEKGFSSAKPTTLSFYVKGNAAAEYTAELRDRDNNRVNSQIFNVTTSWTRVELTYAADTTGKYDNDNAGSLQLNIWVHAGSTYNGGTFTSNTWAANTSDNRAKSSNSSIFDSTSRTLFITGLQYEIGDKATPFEHRSFGEELALCQRYYQKTFPYATTPAQNLDTYDGAIMGVARSVTSTSAWEPCATWDLAVSMRATPTVTSFNPYVANTEWGNSSGVSSGNFRVLARTADRIFCDNTGNTVNYSSNNPGIQLTADAEL